MYFVFCCSVADDKCSLKPCFPFVECTNTPGEGLGFKCGECPPGYMGDGIRCDDVNEVNNVSHVSDNNNGLLTEGEVLTGNSYTDNFAVLTERQRGLRFPIKAER